MKTTNLYHYLFYFGIIWTMLSSLGYILSKGYHGWLDCSMIGVVIFLLSIIQELRLELNKFGVEY